MAQPSVPFMPANIIPPPEMVIRSRREVSTRDATNARQFEHWQTDGKSMTNNRPDMNAQAPFHEFLPINSRFDERNFISQPRYDADGPKLGQNDYFNKYDPSFDSRNATRELKSVVYEDKLMSGGKENRSVIARHFDNRWMSEQESKNQVEVSLKLRPLMDDFTKVYRPY
jgi:hypothetical protein